MRLFGAINHEFSHELVEVPAVDGTVDPVSYLEHPEKCLFVYAGWAIARGCSPVGWFVSNQASIALGHVTPCRMQYNYPRMIRCPIAWPTGSRTVRHTEQPYSIGEMSVNSRTDKPAAL